jgi:energy-coupling factor transporter ATP-binding protein EcfA2
VSETSIAASAGALGAAPSGACASIGSGSDRSAGIELSGLVKSFHGPNGPIRAVRGIDVSIAAGETVALLGPNGAGKSTTIDMLLGLLAPDAGSVSVFGRSPSEAVDQGAVGAMLQTGSLIRDLSVRELVTMMASLYPAPGADRDALAALPGVTGVERRGEAVVLVCADSDAAIRALLTAHPDARDIEIVAAGLEQAFLELTGDGANAGGGAGDGAGAGEYPSARAGKAIGG